MTTADLEKQVKQPQTLSDTEPKPPFPEQSQPSPGLESKLDPQPRWRGEMYKPAGKLSGMAALITGGDSGIGRAVAYFYAREGADVAIVFLPEEREDAEDTQQAIEELGRRCVLIPGDLTDGDFCKQCVETAATELGKIDILVSNAAWQNRKPDVTHVDEDEFDRTLKTNLYAYYRLVKAAVPHMRRGSSIIATGSEVGLQGSSRLLDYSATKGAIHAMTRTLAQELHGQGIRVNCVAPGPVWTPLNVADEGTSAEEVAQFGKKMGSNQYGRPAQPEEIAPAYVFLASEADSSFITGLVLPIIGDVPAAG